MLQIAGENIYSLRDSGYEILASDKMKETYRKINQNILKYISLNMFYYTYIVITLTLLMHGYTVHQQCWTLLLPTDAHNVKKHRVIKTF